MERAKQSDPISVATKMQRSRFLDEIHRGLVRLNTGFLGLGDRYFTDAAIFALVMENSIPGVQHWLAEATGCFLEKMYRKSNTFAAHYLRAVFRLGICHDAEQLGQMNAAYILTPEAIPGGRGTGGVSPTIANHWWHFANVLSLFFAAPAQLDDEMTELIAEPPRKRLTHSGDWWRAMVALAVECLTASKPDPWTQLAAVAEINQHMFRRDYLNNIYEAWLAEMAMSFIVAARDRGYVIPEKGPHPSTPFGLFHLPPRPIIVRPHDYPHDIDDELKAAITKAWKATRKKKRRRRKKAPK